MGIVYIQISLSSCSSTMRSWSGKWRSSSHPSGKGRCLISSSLFWVHLQLWILRWNYSRCKIWITKGVKRQNDGAQKTTLWCRALGQAEDSEWRALAGPEEQSLPLAFSTLCSSFCTPRQATETKNSSSPDRSVKLELSSPKPAIKPRNIALPALCLSM